MLSIDAQHLAESLIAQYVPGWSFGWDRSERRFGCAHFRDKQITLSLPIVQRNGVELVKDTILHEIAHALAGHAAGHGWQWKSMCIRVGANPQRFGNSQVVDTPHNIESTCKCPGFLHKKVRMPKRSLLCRTCRTRLVWKRKGAL